MPNLAMVASDARQEGSEYVFYEVQAAHSIVLTVGGLPFTLDQCDMQKPKCSNCQRRNETCSSSLSVQLLQPATSTGTQPPVSLDTADLPPSEKILPEPNPEDLELLHHFTTEVYRTFTNSPTLIRLYQLVVPKEAFIHSHLMRCVLAISALHLATQSPENCRRYGSAALRHNTAALALIQPLLSDVTPENCSSIFISGLLLGYFSAGLHQTPSLHNNSVLEGLISLAQQAKGIYGVIFSSEEWIRSRDLVPFLDWDSWEDFPPLLPDVAEACEALSESITLLRYSEERQSIYFAALHLLREYFQAPVANPDHPIVSFRWLAFVDRKFLQLMEERDTVALAIAAYHGVLLHTAVADWWWCRDLGARLVSNIYDLLDEQSRHLLTWPMTKIGIMKAGSVDSGEKYGFPGGEPNTHTSKSCDTLIARHPAISERSGEGSQ